MPAFLTRFRACAALIAALLGLALAGTAAAQERTRAFDIPAQSLSGALVEYSRQSGVVIVAPAELLRGRRAPPLHGDYTASAGLQRLLSDSGLQARRRRDGGLTLVAAGAAPSPAALPAAPIEQAPDIVVTGARLHETARAFASAVALATGASEQYARWDLRVCPSVAGLEPAEAQRLIDHIARRAFEVGVGVEGPECEPNIVIIFAPEPNRLAQQIIEQRLDLLGYYAEDGLAAAGREALSAFAETPRPVRWWHVARRTYADGEVSVEGPTRSARSVLSAPVVGSEPTTTGAGFTTADRVRSQGTRLRQSMRQDLSFALIIVDLRRTQEVPSPALADYLSMTALAQIDPSADMTAFSSILNLFAERASSEPPPVAMTVWDLAYLSGLYGARSEAASALQQRNDIARRMAAQLAAD